MNKEGEIIIIEDDLDDQYLFEYVFESLNYANKRVYFKDGESALEYLEDPYVAPFIVLSDINMPRLNGIELRKKLYNDEQLRLKCLPYLLFTSAIDQKMVIDAYSMSVQGFFVKPNSADELKETIKVIIEYWQRCAAPNSF
jgi:CheY-like chemotaxis protein